MASSRSSRFDVVVSLLLGLLLQSGRTYGQGGAYVPPPPPNACPVYTLVEYDVSETIYEQPVVVSTYCAANTVLDVCPGVYLTVANAPTLVTTTVYSTSTVYSTTSETYYNTGAPVSLPPYGSTPAYAASTSNSMLTTAKYYPGTATETLYLNPTASEGYTTLVLIPTATGGMRKRQDYQQSYATTITRTATYGSVTQTVTVLDNNPYANRVTHVVEVPSTPGYYGPTTPPVYGASSVPPYGSPPPPAYTPSTPGYVPPPPGYTPSTPGYNPPPQYTPSLATNLPGYQSQPPNPYYSPSLPPYGGPPPSSPGYYQPSAALAQPYFPGSETVVVTIGYNSYLTLTPTNSPAYLNPALSTTSITATYSGYVTNIVTGLPYGTNAAVTYITEVPQRGANGYGGPSATPSYGGPPPNYSPSMPYGGPPPNYSPSMPYGGPPPNYSPSPPYGGHHPYGSPSMSYGGYHHGYPPSSTPNGYYQPPPSSTPVYGYQPSTSSKGYYGYYQSPSSSAVSSSAVSSGASTSVY